MCRAAILATIALLDDPRSTEPDGEWAEAVGAWNGSRIRKLVRRGRASAWERAQDVPGVTVALHDDEGGVIAEVRAFVPGRMDEAPAGLAKLQIQSTPLEEPEQLDALADGCLPRADGEAMWVAVTPEHEMSWGKRAAQCAHAGQRLWEAQPAPARERWAEAGHPLHVVHVGSKLWEHLVGQVGAPGVVDIHDGGYTEIPAGTLTAIAWWAPSLG